MPPLLGTHRITGVHNAPGVAWVTVQSITVNAVAAFTPKPIVPAHPATITTLVAINTSATTRSNVVEKISFRHTYAPLKGRFFNTFNRLKIIHPQNFRLTLTLLP